MQYKTVGIKFGMTQNLGNYSNARPEVELVAELAEDDDIDGALARMTAIVLSAVHNLVDDELELAGEQVKYSQEQLYAVRYSKLRRCVVIARSDIELPVEHTWKEADSWNHPSSEHGDYPRRMRFATAEKLAAPYNRNGYELVIVDDDSDFPRLPPLPDPGPEPTWSQKGLRGLFRNLNVDESLWEELASLSHVNEQFLESVNNWRLRSGRYLTSADFLPVIRSGAFPTLAEPEPEDEDDYDEDYEEDDEDED